MAGEIQIMIPQYGELNRIYSDFIISHAFSFERQKFITDVLLEEILKERQLNMENLFVKNGVE